MNNVNITVIASAFQSWNFSFLSVVQHCIEAKCLFMFGIIHQTWKGICYLHWSILPLLLYKFWSLPNFVFLLQFGNYLIKNVVEIFCKLALFICTDIVYRDKSFGQSTNDMTHFYWLTLQVLWLMVSIAWWIKIHF